MNLKSFYKFCSNHSRRFLASSKNAPTKTPKIRTSRARGTIVLDEQAYSIFQEGGRSKGAAFSRAQLAGINATRKTPELIPSLGHARLVDAVNIKAVLDERSRTIALTSTVKCPGEHCVDTEAMMAVAIAALTIYDMAKEHNQDVYIRDIELVGGGAHDDARPHQARDPPVVIESI